MVSAVSVSANKSVPVSVHVAVSFHGTNKFLTVIVYAAFKQLQVSVPATVKQLQVSVPATWKQLSMSIFREASQRLPVSMCTNMPVSLSVTPHLQQRSPLLLKPMQQPSLCYFPHMQQAGLAKQSVPVSTYKKKVLELMHARNKMVAFSTEATSKPCPLHCMQQATPHHP